MTFLEFLEEKGIVAVQDPDGDPGDMTLVYEGTNNPVTQSDFAKYMEAWATSDDVFGSQAFYDYVEAQLAADPNVDEATAQDLLALLASRDYTFKNNQNDEGAPYIAELLPYIDFDALFSGADDTSVKTGKTEQTRWYVNEFDLGGSEPENQAPTDIRINIDPDGVFAAAVHGQTGTPNVIGNTSTGDSPLVIGTLSAVDPDDDPADLEFEIVGDPGRFEIVEGNVLRLKLDESISQDDGTFSLTIKVTDATGNEYYETFNFIAGTSGADDLPGTEKGGTGTAADPVVGDDIIFGFLQNDTLNDDGADLTGTSGDDILFGGRGTDELYGGEGDDQLFGGLNGDILIGGSGADIMSGGQGDDTFVWLAGDMAGTNDDHPNGLFDTITDWGTGDNTLDISDLLQDFGFVSGTHDLADWVQVSNDGTDTVVAVATSQADALAGEYTNLVTLLGETFTDVGDLTVVA